MSGRAVLLTAVALTCFAGNSLLCRLALAGGRIDATTFTVVRLVSGAAVLALLAFRRRDERSARSKWVSALALFAYAAPFSYAYSKLGAAIGALILFAAVQATMVGWGVVRGERPGPIAWAGIAVAVGGLVILTVPGKSAPDPLGACTMALAGIAWGAYSLLGRAAAGGDPIAMTTSSFVRSLPLSATLIATVAPATGVHASSSGVVLAAASGALASGAGYSVWYAALRHLSATRAAVLQLLVPVLASAGAIAWLGESVSWRLGLSSAAILGGVALTIRDRATRS